MSSSIKIPSRSTPRRGAGAAAGDKASASQSPSSLNTSAAAMAQGHGHASAPAGSSPALSSSTFTSSSSVGSPSSQDRRRNSYLNSYMSHQDHVVLNVSNSPDTVRLLSYVRSGQGFDWNGDLFLPGGSGGSSYGGMGSSFARSILGSSGGSDEMAMLEHCVPVHEIHLDDDEDMDMLGR